MHDRAAAFASRGAGVALAAAVLTGVSAQSGLVDTGGVRWIHHVLFAAAAGASGIDAAYGVARRSPGAAWAVASTGVLALLPRTRGGTARHASVGVAAALVHLRRRRAGGAVWS